VKCRSCGVAGASFVPADEVRQVNGDENMLRALWIESGLDWATEHAEAPTAQVSLEP
jgi:hypothetical protein